MSEATANLSIAIPPEMEPVTADKSLLDVILEKCRQHADKPALHWLDGESDVVEELSYYEVEQRTRMIARGLADLMQIYKLTETTKHCVVLCYPPGLEFILTFIACLRAGLIAVPVCPPSKSHSAYTTDTFNKIITDSNAVLGLTNKEFCEEPTISQLMGTSTIPWHCELIIGDTNESTWTENEEGESRMLDKSDPKEVILLQYTSGSTGNPKGVMNTNEGVLHNLELTKKIMKTNDQTVEVSFLPHYHDFGLFCSYLQTLYCGATGYFMSPLTFIEKPGYWISCLSKYKATHTQAPNFAFELVLRKGYPDDVELSSLCYIANGSEPVYPNTIERFEKALGPLGLRKNTIRAAYGLAEHTVYVCGVTDEEDPLVINGQISCGKPVPGVKVLVVNPETKMEVSEEEEGEIWVDSGSKALGYWKKINETHSTFEAELCQGSDKAYLRTGDLGFKSKGELFISGRIKDLIVIYGRKIHPSDIEMRIESQFDLLRPGRTIACEYSPDPVSMATNKMGVAYIAELRSTKVNHLAELQSYSMQIATQISLDFQVQTKLVVLIGPGTMPRTTSGKRQRQLCKQKLLNNTLPEVFRWAPPQPIKSPVADTAPFVSKEYKDPTKTEHLCADTAVVTPSIDSEQPLMTAFKEDLASKKRPSIPSFDLVKQFNFEIGQRGDRDETGAPTRQRRSGVTSLQHISSTKLDVNQIMVPEIIDPETTSPARKVRRGSMIVPAITLPSSEVNISVKSFPKEPRLSIDYSGLLGVQDTPRRQSAPPHPVDIEEKRIEDDLRRPSMQDRKVIMRKNERRNSIQTLTNTISKVLGVKIDHDSNIWAYGCNSVKAVQLSRSLQLDFGFSVEPHLLFTHQTPAALLENLQRRLLDIPHVPLHLRERENRRGSKELADWKTQSLDRMKFGRRKSSFGLVTNVRRMSLPKIISDDGGSSTASSNVTPSRSSMSSDEPQSSEESDIAIIGMACSFAGCDNTEELWDLLLGKHVVTSSHKDPMSHQCYNGGFTKATGVFDYQFFGVSEWEASTMDPQQSMLLHTTWECLQNGGYTNTTESLKDIRGSDWGVYVGISLDCDAHFLSSEDGSVPPATSISSSIAANRIARTFDFVGPTVTIDTACASSLSALDAACLSLRAGNCSAALVCGVNALLDKHRFELLESMGMLAPDEKCKVFDKDANGYVRGEGCGAVLLMPISQAKKEMRRISAIIKSTASNNNGAASSTLTSPHTGIQMKLLSKAITQSKVNSTNIRYVEAHGTGTKLGDPIEVDAIQGVLGAKHSIAIESTLNNRPHDKPVFVGSIKANIGHLETGAGIAGLIKTVLVLEHARVPGNPCLNEMNPAFGLSKNIQIPADNVSELQVTMREKVCAIVNSFGFGGTNATAVVQQFGLLPHMARVKCGILFNTKYKDQQRALLKPPSEDMPYIAETIATLKNTFPAFQQALEACEKTGTKKCNCETTAVFQLLYGLSCLLLSLGIEANIVGGIDILGEILALTIAGAIDASYAVQLAASISTGKHPSVKDFQTSIWKPFMPVFSCVLEKVCDPSQYETELGSEYYAEKFLSMFQSTDKRKSYIHTKAVIMMSSQTINTHPLLSLSMGKEPTELSEIEQSLPDITVIMTMNRFIETDTTSDTDTESLPQYIRQKCMKLRCLNDQLELMACSKKPSKTHNTLPRFHERYPLRALVDGIKTEAEELQDPKVSPLDSAMIPRKSSTTSTLSDSGTGLVNESGYLTQTASTESVQETTPTSISMKAPPPSPSSLGIKLGMKLEVKGGISESCIKALWKDEAVIEENPDDKDTENEDRVREIQEGQKKEVLKAILDQVKDELDETDMPLEEVATSGIFELGLDSLNVLQLSDFFKKTYGVHLTFSELTELETLGEVSEVVVRQSTTLQQAATQPPSEWASLPILTEQDYYLIPSLEEMKAMTGEGSKANVVNFTVGRKGHGKIVFSGETDVTDMDIDKLVSIKEQEVVLSKNQSKSEILNKPATITFEGIYPEHDTLESATALTKGLQEYCTTASGKIRTQFISYDSKTGEFAIRVDRFY